MAYFSNGTEGMVLDEQCCDCKLPDDSPCPILWVQMEYNYDQCGNDLAERIMNDLVDTKGNCKMKPLIDKLNVVIPDHLRDDQIKLFRPEVSDAI